MVIRTFGTMPELCDKYIMKFKSNTSNNIKYSNRNDITKTATSSCHVAWMSCVLCRYRVRYYRGGVSNFNQSEAREFFFSLLIG